MSTTGEDGIPYGVPISFVYKDDRIFFHSAVTGHKLDNIEANGHVSFCVVADVETVPDKFTTKYKSVIVFGTAKEVREDEKDEVFQLILEKFSGNFMESGLEYMKKAGKGARIFRIDIERITGKGNI